MQNVMVHISAKSQPALGIIRKTFEAVCTFVGYYHANEGDGFITVMVAPEDVADRFMQVLNAEKDLDDQHQKFAGIGLVVVTPVLGFFQK